MTQKKRFSPRYVPFISQKNYVGKEINYELGSLNILWNLPAACEYFKRSRNAATIILGTVPSFQAKKTAPHPTFVRGSNLIVCANFRKDENYRYCNLYVQIF